MASCNPFGEDQSDINARKKPHHQENSIPNDCRMTELLRVEGIPVYVFNDSKAIYFEAGMSIDADGSPHAFHPDNIGLDDIKNAGKVGNWYGIVTDNNEPTGIPIIQNNTNPAPGYFISSTSLIDKSFNYKDPRRYINSEMIPYFVLPPEVMNAANINVGDIGFIFNKNNNKMMFGIFADVSPIDKIGAGSIALANALGIKSDARKGGIEEGIIYMIFPTSGNHIPKTILEIDDAGARLFNAWGGMNRFKDCILHQTI
jgi:hypothetical protein